MLISLPWQIRNSSSAVEKRCFGCPVFEPVGGPSAASVSKPLGSVVESERLFFDACLAGAIGEIREFGELGGDGKPCVCTLRAAGASDGLISL